MTLEYSNYSPAIKAGAVVDADVDYTDSIDTDDIKADAVTTAKIADGAITVAKLSATNNVVSVQYTAETAIATTGAVTYYLQATASGVLSSASFANVAGLTKNDTNYVTFTLVNLGTDGTGSTAMLAVAAANTTKATGGVALVANAINPLVLHPTPANLAVTTGERLALTVTQSGTLANTLTFPTVALDILKQ